MNIILVYLMGIQGATIATVICSYIIYAVRKRAVGKDIWIKDYFIIIVTWMLLFVQAFVESYLSIVPIEIAIMAMEKSGFRKIREFVFEGLVTEQTYQVDKLTIDFLPKQFLTVENKPIIIYTLEAFQTRCS